MVVGWWIRGALSAAFMLAVVGPSAAQEKKEPRKGDSSGGYSAIIDNIDMLVENYAKFLGRKYDLNDDQFTFTKQMLRDKVYGFLDKNETDVRDLFDQMFQARTSSNMSQEGLIEWGKRVAPIYEEAKKIIENSNNEWRDVLNDQQRAIHDEDLKLMKQSFDETDEKLKRIQVGEMTIEEFVKPSGGRGGRRGAAPRPAPVAVPVDSGEITAAETPQPINSPGKQQIQVANRKSDANGAEDKAPLSPIPVDGRPPGAPIPPDGQPVTQNGQTGEVVAPAGEAQPAGQPVVNPEVVNPPPADHAAANPARPEKRGPQKGPGRNFESEWEKYVREFIQRYQLGDEQSQKANGILAECEQQAERLLAAKKGELEKIEKREAELKTTPATPPSAAGGGKAGPANEGKAKESAELVKRRDEILNPINRIFEDQLKPKLEKLPTRAQRKAAEEATAKKGAGKTPVKVGGGGKDGNSGEKKP